MDLHMFMLLGCKKFKENLYKKLIASFELALLDERIHIVSSGLNLNLN